MTTADALADFVEAACVPLDSGHATGTLERAQAILSAHPDLADGNVYAAAILGDERAVRRFLHSMPAMRRRKAVPATGTR